MRSPTIGFIVDGTTRTYCSPHRIPRLTTADLRALLGAPNNLSGKIICRVQVVPLPEVLTDHLQDDHAITVALPPTDEEDDRQWCELQWCELHFKIIAALAFLLELDPGSFTTQREYINHNRRLVPAG